MQIHKMKLHAHQSLLFTLLLALYLCPSLTFSLHQLSRQTEPLPFLNAQVLTDLTEETESSDGDYYQLVAFVDYLRDYNFSSGWMNSDTSDDDNTDSAAGLTFHMCTPNPSGGTQIMALYCYLLIGSMTSNSSYSQSFVFDLEEANYTLSSINSELGFLTVPTNVTLHNDTQPATNQICMGNLTYSFINSGTNQPYNYNYDSMSDLSLQISFQGLNCSVQISTSLLTVDRSGGPEPQVIAYVAPMAVIALLQIFCCYKLMRNFNSSANIAKRASVGTISFFITFDFYVFLMNFEYWTILPNLMLVVVVLFGLLALIIQPVTVYFVFKGVRRTNDLNLIMSLFFKLALWLLVTLASAIVSLTYVPNVICYVYPFFLLPQIMDNIFINRKHKWNIWFIIMGFSNLLYIGYVAFDPLHLFNLNLSPIVFICAVAMALVMLALLKVQTRWPTFGFKSEEKHDYSDLGSPQEKQDALTDLCSICMERLDQKPLNGPTTPLLDTTSASSEILRTPCKHYYHDSCLHEWVKKKLECPNCRQAIPLLVEEDE